MTRSNRCSPLRDPDPYSRGWSTGASGTARTTPGACSGQALRAGISTAPPCSTPDPDRHVGRNICCVDGSPVCGPTGSGSTASSTSCVTTRPCASSPSGIVATPIAAIQSDQDVPWQRALVVWSASGCDARSGPEVLDVASDQPSAAQAVQAEQHRGRPPRTAAVFGGGEPVGECGGSGSWWPIRSGVRVCGSSRRGRGWSALQQQPTTSAVPKDPRRSSDGPW